MKYSYHYLATINLDEVVLDGVAVFEKPICDATQYAELKDLVRELVRKSEFRNVDIKSIQVRSLSYLGPVK